MKLAIILGTRPEIIKMSPVIRAAQQDPDVDPFILHTGQHYSYELDQVFFEQLGLPEADHNLDVGSGKHGEQTGKMMSGIEEILEQEAPDAVLVQGDTNTVVAGAMVASKMDGVILGHVEAGLRSYDRSMPEEHNRVVADHLSDLLFAPTEDAAEILRKENLPDGRIHVTGNTIVDAVQQNRKVAEEKSTILEDLGLRPGGYILMTAHRQENVDDEARFKGIIDGVNQLARELDVPVIYPIHPRARKMLDRFELDTGDIQLSEPVAFLDFLHLEANARLACTDSGGVQEETCILGTPCLTLRENTERPETLEVGSNRLAGTDPTRIVKEGLSVADAPRDWGNPFGDGQAGQKILTLTRQETQP